MSGIPQEALKQLKQFVTILKTNPDFLHASELSFFKEYLESLGATIPPPKPKQEPKQEPPKQTPPPKQEAPKQAPPPKQEAPPKTEEKVEEMETDEAPEPEDTNLWAPDNDPPLPFGSPDKAVNDEDIEAAGDLMNDARSAARDGNFHEAIEKLTEAIKRNPGQSTLYAFRAEYLVKQKKPNAAIRDADKALQLNPDSTRALKARGKAKRHLGKYLEASYDLRQGNSLDWDENTEEMIKDIAHRAERALQKQRKEDEKARIDQLKREAAEKRRRQQEEEQEDADAAAGLGGMFSQFGDPEITELLTSNPQLLQKVMKALGGDVSALSDPDVVKILSKLKSKFGAPPQASGHDHPHDHAHDDHDHSHGHAHGHSHGHAHAHPPPQTAQKPSTNDDLD